MSGGVRVSIPNHAKKTIQNIREIAGNHSDDEIYAMLKECSMDPNETAQRLLLQDTFHEVKRKRDKKKENPNSKESAESRWRPGTQGRGGRGGRGNYAPRYNSYDAGGRTANAGKENVVNKGTERAVTPSSLPASQEVESKATLPVSSFVTSMSNKPVNASYGSTNLGSAPEGRGANHPVESSVADDNKLGIVLPAPPINTESKTTVSQQNIDYLQVDRHVSRDVTNSVLSSSMHENDASGTVNSSIHGNMTGKSQEVENNQLTELSQPSSLSTQGGASTGRPSSNYGNRPQQPIGSQKVGPIKEWKPKPTTSNPGLLPGTICTSEVLAIRDEAGDKSLPTSSVSASEASMSSLQKKLKELSFSDGQHVIIPNHLQVPEAAKSGLSFGSFDTSFIVNTSYVKATDNDKSPTPLSESSHEIEETAEDPSSSNQNASLDSHEGDYHHHPQSPKNMPENPSSGEAGGSVPEYDQSKPEMPLPPAGPLYSVVHTAPTYSSFGLMPPILGTQFAPFDSSEPQARDVSRLPSFVSANSLVLSTAGPTPLVTQAAGVMQSSIAMTQQPVPVYRQPAGVHISHYPPNYIPYSQFISPFYVPPPTIHHFLSNAAYPQQPPTGNVYPSPAAAAAATGVKYSLPHYKPGANTGNSSHIGMPTGYGPYSSSPAGYNPNPTTTAGNSTGSEDRAASQYKENNVYITGQQTEGSAVWVPAPSRDVSGLQPGSFYNLPPQGQHVTYAATQGGHGAFTGVYHPAQTVAAATVHPVLQQSQSMTGSGEIVGPPTGLYQQAQQRGQINWTSNY